MGVAAFASNIYDTLRDIFPRRAGPYPESSVAESGIPKPGPLEVHLKDDHLQYAITWFALAGAVVIAFGVWLRGRTGP